MPHANGSEFAGAFDEYAKQQGWRHCYTCPRYPKMNARNERFNRTVQEEFVEYFEYLLPDDLPAFNEQMLSCLQRFNGERPHQGLGYPTPTQTIALQIPNLSKMWWPHTMCCVTGAGRLQ